MIWKNSRKRDILRPAKTEN